MTWSDARGAVLATLLASSIACGGGAECLDDAACDASPADAGVDALLTDAGTDARGLDDDGGAAEDADVDAGFDAGFDAGPPAAPTRFTLDRGAEAHDAVALGDGMLVVGDVRSGSEVDAAALLVSPDGEVRWAAEIQETGRGLRLYAAARRDGAGGAEHVAVGSYRSDRGGSRNNDALVVGVSATGLARPRVFGTTGDELLFGVAEGGAVAAWIGVGECGASPNRRGLVVAINADLTVRWARCVSFAGHDAYFVDAAVVGDAVFAVGAADAPARRLLIARVATEADTPTTVEGWRSSLAGAGALAARPTADGGGVDVVGRLDERPVRLRLSGTGELLEAARLDTFGALSNLWRAGSSTLYAGVYSPPGPFVATPFLARDDAREPTVARLSPFESAAVSGFLRTPVAAADGAPRVVARRGGAILDLPFNDALEVGCPSDAEAVAWQAVEAPLTSAMVTTAALALLGPSNLMNASTSMATGVAGCGP